MDLGAVLETIAVVLASVGALGAYHVARQAQSQAASAAVVAECVADRAGVTDDEIRAWHWEHHPECRPEMEAGP